jgi:hypothetical protein
MPQRKSKNEPALIGFVVLMALPIWLVSKITDNIGGAFVVCVVLILALVVFYFIRKRARPPSLP